MTIKIPPCKECGEEPGMLRGKCGECMGATINRGIDRGIKLRKEEVRRGAKAFRRALNEISNE